jgi:hypothetical protein
LPLTLSQGLQNLLSLTYAHSGALIEVTTCGFPKALVQKEYILYRDGYALASMQLQPCSDGSSGFGWHVPSQRVFFTLEGDDRRTVVLQAKPNNFSGPTAEATLTILNTDRGPLPPPPRIQITAFGSGIRDMDTSLIWERGPDLQTTSSWQAAQAACTNKTVGRRVGWRLPTVEELLSILERRVWAPDASSPVISIFRPFDDYFFSFSTSIGARLFDQFWTATPDPQNPQQVLGIDLASAAVRSYPKSQAQTLRAWCVLGMPGRSPQ